MPCSVPQDVYSTVAQQVRHSGGQEEVSSWACLHPMLVFHGVRPALRREVEVQPEYRGLGKQELVGVYSSSPFSGGVSGGSSGSSWQGAPSQLSPAMGPAAYLVVGLNSWGAPSPQVEEFRKKDAEKGVKVAQVLQGFVSRKVVKQTVMTVVYGVTRYGGRLQMEKRLKEIEFPEVVSLPWPPQQDFAQLPVPTGREACPALPGGISSLPCSVLTPEIPAGRGMGSTEACSSWCLFLIQ